MIITIKKESFLFMLMKYYGLVAVLALLLGSALSGCFSEAGKSASSAGASGDTERVSVVVSILPQRFFAERIGGDKVRVDVLTPPNYAAETYQITPRQMDALGRADVYFGIGMPFEAPLISRLAANFPALRIVDTREGVSLLSMSAHHHHHEPSDAGDDHDHDHDPETCDHDHDHADDHDHSLCLEGDDPHIWLDPMRVKIQARTMTNTLADLAPQEAAYFKSNLESFEQELDELHRLITELLDPVKGRAFYVFHPAFGYFAEAYGLEQRPIEYEGKSPGPRRLYAIIEEIREAGARALFEQPQFQTTELATIAREAGVQVVLLDDLAEDYPDNMMRMARAVLEHLRDEAQ